ncbi:hypothetical protein NC652_032345 [Populus alba x Populus x berolinensis]|nr:hypothetical protein NC652_032345 [Populus alba x Populus x berolinensis]
MNLAPHTWLSSPKPNLSFFHSLLKSHIETHSPKSALLLFRHLLQSNLKPNDFTFSLILKSFTSIPLNEKLEANQIHNHLLKSGFDQFVYISTALLDFYMKLGCVHSARNLFDHMPDRDVVSWNALICGCSRNGYDVDALESFVQMLREGFSPLQTTLVGLVPSCGRREFVFQGRSIHGFGIKTGIDLDSQVKNALTYMYAKSGDLEAAELLFEELEDKSVVSWNTMIGAYAGNVPIS